VNHTLPSVRAASRARFVLLLSVACSSESALDALPSASLGAALRVADGVATLSPGDVLGINFQTPTSSVPVGYFRDFGQPFGLRTAANQGGLSYGWVVPGSHTPLNISLGGVTPGNGRRRAGPADPRLATLMHMQADDLPVTFNGTRASGAFELALANGVYSVLVSVGDSAFFDSVHGIDLEGVPAIVDYTPSSSDPFQQQRLTVEVHDGTLTITPTGTNTKINFIDVQLASDLPGCGNGDVEVDEGCDVGNVTSGDGCSATCQIEGPCIPALSQFPGEVLSSLRCEDVRISTPFAANFTGTGTSGIEDGAGRPIGFSMVLPSSLGTGYLPQNLALNSAQGELLVTTTAGIQSVGNNRQDNSLGVGLALPNGAFRIETTIVNPPAGSGQYEQAGIWFGISERDYIKLAVMSSPLGLRLHALIETNDTQGPPPVNRVMTLPADTVHLVLEADPTSFEVRAFAKVGTNGTEALVTTFTDVPDAWFSTDGAGIDFTVGTRSFAGIFATHRLRSSALGPLTYRFRDFVVNTIDDPTPEPPPPPSVVDFTRFSVPLTQPTALDWGPDSRLYVASVTGPIHALTFDFDTQTVIDDDVTNALAGRLVLGLTVDPASTPNNVILWAGHSDVQQSSGDANSGMVSRLSGPSLSVRQDVITGLPRAIANHSTNAVHFGPDGRLYIAQGGNTGAGAANDSTSEFGPRPEQPLSAAILVADVNAPGFDGSCTPTDDPLGAVMDSTGIASRSVPCDVEVYASGLRNAFDFTFTRSGRMFAVDNGLGVEGAHPALAPSPLSWAPASGCEGPVLGLDNVHANNPGTRADLLLLIQEGGYYGHPNPSRDECIFYGGNPSAGPDGPVPETGGTTHFQEALTYPVGRQPAPNFRPAVFSFGGHKSTNAVIEYESDVFCGALRGDLLVSYFSGFDQIRRLTLNDAGTSVVGDVTLRRSSIGAGGPSQLVDPISMTQDPEGRIYVSEFSGRVTVFDPIPGDCD